MKNGWLCVSCLCNLEKEVGKWSSFVCEANGIEKRRINLLAMVLDGDKKTASKKKMGIVHIHFQ